MPQVRKVTFQLAGFMSSYWTCDNLTEWLDMER